MTSYQFSPEYKESVFYSWYKSGRPKLEKFVRSLSDSENGRRPNKITVSDWIQSEGWIERADALDAEVSQKLDIEVIDARVKQLREMAQLGEKLMKEGYEYIKNEGFDSAAAAVRAVGLGSDMMFRYAAAADYLAKIGTMSNKQLERELRKLLGKGEEGVIEAEAEDVEEPNGDGSEDDND